MTREEIVEKVNAVLAEEFEVELSVFTPDADIKDALSLDSLSLVDLVAIIQYTYKVKVPASDLPKIKTFNDLYDYIEAHLPAE
ncbi:MAG: acyl carrier protein [Bacteroides sp.]|nr:acyl carrier protein [Bacteroides sp.]